MMHVSLRIKMFCVVAALTTGCSANPSASALQNPIAQAPGGHASLAVSGRQPSLNAPALLTINSRSGVLESWPLQRGGGVQPQVISNPLGIGAAQSMVGNGHVVAITAQYPPEVVLYNLDTKNERTLPDPLGTPTDIAIDKNATLYVINIGRTDNVGMYPAGSSHETELICKVLSNPEEIAVDNEGDIFINGYGPGRFVGVAEIPNGPNGPEPQNCTRFFLKSEPGFTAGLAIDPKTDDLIVLDDPGQCAGGPEGRMTIYPKPYQKATGRTRLLGGNCVGGLRLNADSTIVFYGDADVSGSFGFIRQRAYPGGGDMGTYNGGDPGGFSTIPNTLPN
jgi:hypothetical protein